MSYLLSIDGSSSEIGYGIWDKQKKELITLNHYTHNPEHSLIEKVFEFENLLKSLKEAYPQLDEFVIEEAFIGFKGGMSSANTITTLISVNFGYQLMAKIVGFKVSTISVNESRKNCFPGIKIRTLAKMQKLKEKEFCFNLVEDELKSYFKTKIISKGKRKGIEVYESWTADLADAYIIGRGFLNKK